MYVQTPSTTVSQQVAPAVAPGHHLVPQLCWFAHQQVIKRHTWVTLLHLLLPVSYNTAQNNRHWPT